MNYIVRSVQEAFDTEFCPKCGIEPIKEDEEMCRHCRERIRLGARWSPALRAKINERNEVLKCKWEGCENDVNSHKGLAGYCAKAVEAVVNGESRLTTHREMYCDKRRETDPNFGSHQPVRQSPTKKLLFRNEGVRQSKSGTPWLHEVKQRIGEAMDEVASAEENLASAKSKLRELLGQAQEALR